MARPKATGARAEASARQRDTAPREMEPCTIAIRVLSDVGAFEVQP